MKHPNEQDWMEYLYGETDATQKAALETHLSHCPLCQQQTASWREAMEHLDQWQLPAPNPRQGGLHPWSGAWKWAAAACLVFTTAFAAGRFTVHRPDAASIQAQIAEPIRQSIARELDQTIAARTAAAVENLQQDISRQINEAVSRAGAEAFGASQKQLDELAVTLATLRDEDKKIVLAALQEMEARRLNDLRALRQELETVAVNTDQSFRLAQRQLVQLAAYSQPNP